MNIDDNLKNVDMMMVPEALSPTSVTPTHIKFDVPDTSPPCLRCEYLNTFTTEVTGAVRGGSATFKVIRKVDHRCRLAHFTNPKVTTHHIYNMSDSGKHEPTYTHPTVESSEPSCHVRYQAIMQSGPVG